MCGPAALAVASLAATAVGGYMQYQQQKAYAKDVERAAVYDAQAIRAETDMQAQIDADNRQRAEFLAEDAIARGKADEQEERLRGRMLIGQMRAALASSGQVVDEGSASDLVIDQSATNELNAQTVRTNAAREAQDFRIRATQFDQKRSLGLLAGENEAQRTLRTGQTQSRRIKNEATGTLIGTAGSVASKWYQFDKAGAFA